MLLRRHNNAVGSRLAAIAATTSLLLSACAFGDDSGDDAQGADGSRKSATDIDCAEEGKVLGVGSTAQKNAMKRWVETYEETCRDVRVAYWAQGSAAGVSRFMRSASAFGASDSPLTASQIEQSREVCPGGRAIDLPMVGGPIAIGFNLSGVDDLVLDAPTLARIFDSKITHWNDPAIQKLNPAVKLPALPMQAVHRSDGSGTTQNLNAYLSGAASVQWPYPAEKSWQGHGGQAASGSDGVVSQVLSTDGAIGYFELSFAAAKKIKTVRIDSGAGEAVAPTAETASAAIGAARFVGTDGDLTLAFDYSTRKPGAYPIVLITYEIVCNKGNKADTLAALKSFLAYTAGEEGQKILPEIHYAPLPDSVAAKVRQTIPTLR